MKKKILFFETGSPTFGGHEGGSMYSLLELLRSINKNKFDCFVVLYHEFDIINEYRYLGANVIIRKNKTYSIKAKNILNKIICHFINVCFKYIEYKWLKKFIIKNKINIFHGNDRFTSNWIGVCAAKSCNIKIIIHQRQFETCISKKQIKMLPFIDFFIAISSAIKKDIQRFYFYNEKIKVIHNWVNLKTIIDVGEENRYNSITTRKLSLLWIGRLTEWKGFHILVEIASFFIDKGYTNFKIDFYGEFSDNIYKDQIFESIKKRELENYIFYKGYLSFINIKHEMYDVLLHTSIKPEPFGRTIIEAMSKNILVCASKFGGVQDIIIHKKNGYLLDYKDYFDVLKTIKYIHENPENDFIIIKEANKYIKEKFSGCEQIQSIERIYDEL